MLSVSNALSSFTFIPFQSSYIMQTRHSHKQVTTHAEIFPELKYRAIYSIIATIVNLL